MAILRIVEGQAQGLWRELGDSPITIGRDASNHIQIGDPKASRTHVRISWTGSTHQLVDLDSSNGTWNDEGRIRRLDLEDGSLFRIGSTYFQYEEDAGQGGAGTLVVGDQEWRAPTKVETLLPGESFLTGSHSDPEELARANQFLVLMYQTVLRSSQATSREELFELIDDLAAEALEGDRCAIFLPVPEGWQLWPQHRRRLKARFGSIPFANSLLQNAARRPEPLLCTYGEGDYELSASMVQAGVRSAMTAPLRVGEDIHALLYVDRLHGDAAFTRRDLEFLAAVANQLAIRLVNTERLSELSCEVDRLKRAVEAERPPVALVGKSRPMQDLRGFVERAAPTDAPVLILGESGTGKEVTAQAIHAASARQDQPLQVLNCAAIAEHLVEATLFGHVKGAFTGADDTRPGMFELADGGTLFLDEIGDLPIQAQAKLLRAIEQGEVQRIGDPSVRRVDVRIIAATNIDLQEAVQSGTFRADLYHRLDVLTIELPPLRNRPEDIEPLIDHFLDRIADSSGDERKQLSPRARAVLLGHDWPGNVRQLRNSLERAAILGQGQTIDVEDLPESLAGAETPEVRTPIVSLAEMERAHILRVLDHCGGNKKASAEVLGIDRSTLYAKLRQYGTI